ncbi:MAG: tryptophan-rich sensory protein [Myxococcales bacterium]|nr:tryptophan-rich sensory protein [Myxococcales bacterium]
MTKTPPSIPLRVALSALPVVLVGWGGSFATRPRIESWYEALAKPSFTPPNWLFGPAWAVLYVAMGIAAYRLWSRPPSPPRRRALALFYAQLALNGAWSFAFFGAQSPELGLVVILPLLALILVCIRLFWPIDRAAAALFAPYAAWVGFATALNVAIMVLNR